jgi:hypothetical protein
MNGFYINSLHICELLINIMEINTEFVLNHCRMQFAPHRKQVSATKFTRLMLFMDEIAIYCENHAEHTNTLCAQNA